MIFDWTVSVTNVITVIGVMFGGLIALLSMKSDLRIISIRVERAETDLKNISEKINSVSEILIQMAHFEERINRLDGRMSKVENSLSNPR